MKRYLLAILLLCGVAYAGDVYRVRIPALGIDTTVEVEKVETPPLPPPEPEPEPEPEPDPTPTPEPPPPGEIADGLLPAGQRDVLKRLWATKHPLAMAVQSLADNDLAYNQQGEWATLVYLATGNDAYAQKAFSQFRARWIDPSDAVKVNQGRSDTREFLVTIAQHYEWCRPGLTDDQAAEWRRLLFVYADLCLGPQPPWGTRLNDDDETAGHYFGLLKVAQVTAKEDAAKSKAILDNPQLPAMRDAIKRICAYAKGGEWVSADGYNVGTTKVMLIGLFATGEDDFPEVLEYLKAASEQHAWTIAPDFKSSVKWGDTSPDDGKLDTTHIAYSAMLAGLMGNRNERALYEILAKQQPWWIELYRVLWCIDPTEDVSAYVAPSGFRSTGVGLSIHRGPQHLLQVFTPRDVTVNGNQIDHTTHQMLDVRLWYDGEWVIEHPIGYPPSESSYNTVLFAGFGRFIPQSETVELVSAEGTDSGCKVVWRLKMREAPYTTPPFVNDFTRTLEFTAPNRLAITDKFDGTAPDLASAYWSDQYKKWQADVVRAAPALWQSIYHTPVAPTKTATGYEWATKGGHKVTLTTDARAIVLKTTPENTPGSYAPGQLDGSQIRLLSDEPTAELKATLEVN